MAMHFHKALIIHKDPITVDKQILAEDAHSPREVYFCAWNDPPL